MLKGPIMAGCKVGWILNCNIHMHPNQVVSQWVCVPVCASVLTYVLSWKSEVSLGVRLREAVICKAMQEIRESCLPLCNPMDCSPPGSSVHGNLQARILEEVAISHSRESSQPRDQTCISCVSALAGRLFTTKPRGVKSLYNIVRWIWDWNGPGSNSSFATQYHGLLREFIAIWPIGIIFYTQ